MFCGQLNIKSARIHFGFAYQNTNEITLHEIGKIRKTHRSKENENETRKKWAAMKIEFLCRNDCILRIISINSK